MPAPKTPTVAVDVIIELDGKLPSSAPFGRGVPAGAGLLLVERKHEPLGWALPGGFVDVGEAPAHAAVREAKEETSLDVELVAQFHAYGRPDRDPRGHAVSIVYVARDLGTAKPRAADDAKTLGIFALDALPKLAFDHAAIIADYAAWKRDGSRPPATR